MAQQHESALQIAALVSDLKSAQEATAKLRDDAVRSKVPSVAQADFETLREENIQLRRDHGQMLAQLKETRENLAAVTAANTRLAQADQTSKDSGPDSLRFRSLLEDNKRLNEEVKRSTAELSSLYRQVRELERKLEQGVSYKPSAAEGVSPEVADLNRQLDKLREENGNLTKENSRLAAASSNTVRPDEVEKLRRQIAEITTSRDALTGDKMALEKRLADFTGAAAKVGVDLTDLRSSAAETKRSLIDALREKEDLRAQLDSAKSGLSVQARRFEAQLSDIRKTAAAAVAPNSESERRLTEAIAQVVELRNELLEAKSKAAQIETKLRQSEMGAQKLAVELAPTKETVASLNAQLDEAKKALAQRTSATADAARLVEQLKTARSEVEKATNAAKTVSEEKFELTAKSAELAAQVLKVTAELKSAREAARKGTEASTQVAPLTKELAQSQANVAQAQAQLRDSESGAKKLAEQVGPMKAELARLSAQLDEAKTALNQKTSEAADAALLGGKLKTVQANFEVAAIAAKAAAEVREQLIAKSAEHAAQIQKLTADLANAREVVGKGAGAATQVAALNKELTEAKARAAQMETQLRVAEVGTKKLTEELAAAQNATAKSQNAAQQFEKIKQQLAQEQAIARSAGESELAKLRAKLADATQHLGNKETERAANEQSLRKALDEAGAQLASEKSSNEKLSKVSANLAEENHRLSDQVALLTEGRVTAVQNSVRGLAESRSLSEQLKKTNAELLEQNAKLTSDNEKISAQLTSAGGLTGQIDQLKSDLAAAQTAQASDKETLAKLNGQLDNAGKAITDLKGKNDELQKDLEVAKQSAAAALAAQAAAAKAAPETAALNLELQTLREHVRRLEGEIEDDRASSAREISSLAGQLQRTKESSRALAEANHALLESKNSDDSSVKADLEQLKAKIQTLMGENEKLLATKQQLAKENDLLAKDKRVAEQAADDAKKSAAAPAAWAQERDNLRTQVDDMFNKLSDSERRMAQLKQSSDAARTLAQNAQNEADKAQADLAALRSRLTESDKAVEQHNASVAELTGLNEKLSGEKTELQAQLVQSRQMMDKARDDISALKSRLTASDHMAEKSASSVSELSASNEKYTTQVKDLAAQIASLRADNARLPELGADVVAREKELSDVRSKLAESEKATELHRSSVAELSGVNDKLAVEKASLQKQLDAVNAELSMLRNDNSRLAQIEQRAASLEAVSAQLATSQRDIVSVRAENSRLNDTVQALDRDRTARITQLQQENSAIASRLRQAQGTLDQIANAARIINGTMGSSTSTVSPARPINSTELGAASSESRFHVVQEGDSLSRISVRYYGTANRWQDIYDANRELLKGENALRPGQRLRIP